MLFCMFISNNRHFLWCFLFFINDFNKNWRFATLSLPKFGLVYSNCLFEICFPLLPSLWKLEMRSKCSWKTAAIGTDLRPHLRSATIVVAYCHVLNMAKICLQAVNKGPMAALFEMWPKKGLFYVIIGHVVIPKKKN